jgi:hypothetical protein
MKTIRMTALLTVSAVALAALAAACGGGGGDTTTAQAESANSWAEGVCSAMVTWESSLSKAAQPVSGGNLTKDSLSQVTGDMKSATDTFVSDIKSLAPPNTSSGQQAKDAMDSLANSLSSDVDTIKKAADNVNSAADLPAALSTISSTATTMGNQAKTTFDDIQKLDVKGELNSAFKSSSSCKQLGVAPGS